MQVKEPYNRVNNEVAVTKNESNQMPGFSFKKQERSSLRHHANVRILSVALRKKLKIRFK